MIYRSFFLLLVSMVVLARCETRVQTNRCPEMKSGSVGICANLCSSDSSCAADEICCGTACGGTYCAKPRNTPPIKTIPQKPGTCPANVPNLSRTCVDQCSNDYNCDGDLLCCRNSCGGRTCVPSVESSKPVPPPSRCPEIKSGSVGICANLCSSDSSCAADEICCGTACGGTYCTKPIDPAPISPLPPPRKPGTCPANKPNTAGIRVQQCTIDYDCSGDLLCCRNSCGGTECVPSLESTQPVEHPGTCPAIEPSSVGICGITCQSDGECSKDQKCCRTACGGTQCVSTGNNTPPAEKPGTCPANDPDSAGICIVQCSNDYECDGDLKCCKNQCGGGVCVKSVEASQPSEHLGTCPAITPGAVGFCANLCFSDSSCSKDQKCCPTPCGGTRCQTAVNNTPPTEKPGTCPANDPDSAGICIVQCSNDYECEGDLKCCKNQCGGGVCVKTVEASQPPEHPGTCPAIIEGSVGICAFLCINDNSCSQDKKCCPTACGGSQCLPAVINTPPAEKPGTCPANKPGSIGICIVECGNDYECKGDLKCCPNPCGGGVCVKSVEASQPPKKPGTCPAPKRGAAGICITECKNDYECKGDLKCCPNPCGDGICVKSVEASQPVQKPGTCPKNKPGSVGICSVECGNDYECKGDLKCCPNPCGGGFCVKSVEASKPIDKPGVCPPIQPGTGGICANMCDGDGSCPNNLKCCSNACGGTACIRPLEPWGPVGPVEPDWPVWAVDPVWPVEPEDSAEPVDCTVYIMN